MSNADELARVLALTVPALERIPIADWYRKDDEKRWSAIEVLGHLVDSACVNHYRFLTLQQQDVAVVDYDQDHWVSRNGYQQSAAADLLTLWCSYNKHLVHVLQKMEACDVPYVYGTGVDAMSAPQLAASYIQHMQHHLQQIAQLTGKTISL